MRLLLPLVLLQVQRYTATFAATAEQQQATATAASWLARVREDEESLGLLRAALEASTAGFFSSELAREILAALEKQRDELSSLIRHIASNRQELQLVAPAVQWAESEDTVYLQVKMAARWSSPGALSVDDEKVQIAHQEIRFSGVGTHSGVRKQYQLALPLKRGIVVEESKWHWGGLGKLLFKLKKAELETWESLMDADRSIPSSVTQWWEMIEKLEAEKQREEAERKSAAEKEKKELEEKKKKQETEEKGGSDGPPENHPHQNDEDETDQHPADNDTADNGERSSVSPDNISAKQEDGKDEL